MRTAYAVLLDNSQDHFDAEKNLNTSFPDFAFIKDVYAKLCSYFEIGVGSGQDERFEFDIIEFVNHFQLSLLPSLAACKELEKAGWIVLTEAVFEPPKMMILLNRNEIDEFLHQNKATGQLLQVLIRNYEGLFSNYVAFSHKKLARLLDTTIPEIERLLDQLKTIGIIDYKAISEKPILELLQARVSNRNFSIDLKSYKLRKKNAYARLKSMIRYVESTDCREQEILAYFSESKSAPCSRCDLCLGSAKVNYTKDELKHVLELLEKLTKDGPIDFRQFVELYPKHHENRTLTILDHLKHEGIISITDYQIEWTKADG
jgi:ATP-dependent DNA helicase RecQ